jgi:hypothetical protein
LDNLWIHGGRKKISWVCKVGEYYMNKEFIHAKNEHSYATTKKDIIINQIYLIIIGKRINILVNFFVYFVMFCDNKPMIDYGTMNKLMHFLDVKNFSNINSLNTIC